MALLFYDHDISSMQKELEEDLKDINCKIALSNTEQSLPTLRFDCDLLKTSVKKRTGRSSVKTVLKYNLQSFMMEYIQRNCLKLNGFLSCVKMY